LNLQKSFFLLYRKFPLFRTSFYVFIIAAVLITVSIITVKTKKIPAIHSIDPQIGLPGDTMTIKGENFGMTRGSSYVEIGNNRITASGYIQWTDNQIQLILPSNIQDGLIFVVTSSGKSEPEFFANEHGIPVAVPPDTKTLLPTISSVTPASGVCNGLLTINGTNFGTIRGKGCVLFSANREDAKNEASRLPQDIQGELDIQYIPANEQDFDYEYWSDNEIRVRIPDGAEGGVLVVKTEKGLSNVFKIDVKFPIGKKTYSDRKTYLIQLNADIDSIDAKTDTNIMLKVPRPVKTAGQPMAELTECKPEPSVYDFKNTIIHQVELQKNSQQTKKLSFSQNFVISVYSIKTNINEKQVKPFSEKSRILYKMATTPDKLIRSGDEDFTALAKSIVGNETNPYTQARLIYEYITKNYRLVNIPRKADANPKDLIKRKSGDAYDFSIVFTTLLRACKIPCLPVSGILIDADKQSKPHWWTEFYIENFGWIPVDVALGIGLEYRAFKPIANTHDFYFGNLDSQHIAFSRGWNEVKQSLINSKVVYRPKSYALQSIWEESSSGNINYSSLWNDPIVLGIY